jgi:hypothetical protein
LRKRVSFHWNPGCTSREVSRCHPPEEGAGRDVVVGGEVPAGKVDVVERISDAEVLGDVLLVGSDETEIYVRLQRFDVMLSIV